MKRLAHSLLQAFEVMKSYLAYFLSLFIINRLLSQEVLELASQDFSQFLASEKLVLVNVYVPWCGYCQILSPILENTAQQAFDENLPVKIAQFDGAADATAEEIVLREKVDGYPTLLVYKNGARIGEYRGNRSESDLISYLKAKAAPAAKYIESQLDLVPYLSVLDHTETFEHGVLAIVIGIFPPSGQGINGKVAQTYIRVAEKYDLAIFFIADSEKLIDDFKIKNDSIIVFNADEHDVYHSIAIDEDTVDTQVIDEIIALSMPLSISFTKDTQPLLSSLPITAHALCFYDAKSSSGDSDSFLDAVMASMPKFKGKIIMIEVSSDEFQLLHYFHIELTSDLPQLILLDLEDPEDVRRYLFADFAAMQQAHALSTIHLDEKKLLMRRTRNGEEELIFFNQATIEDFFSAFLNRQLSRSLFFQDESEIDKLNEDLAHIALKNINSAWFIQLVLGDAERDSLVYFYSPTCIHCKAAEALVHDLAKYYERDSKIRCYRIDGTKNEVEHPAVRILGFPAIYLFPAKTKKEVAFEYEGDRSKSQEIYDWVKSHRSYPDEMQNLLLYDEIGINENSRDGLGSSHLNDEARIDIEGEVMGRERT